MTSTPALFDGPPGRTPRRQRRDRDSEMRPRTIRLPDHDIRTEHQLIRLLEDGVYHLDDIVDASVNLGLADRTNGRSRRKRGDLVFRHRVRSALDARKQRAGDTRPLGDAYWIIDGTPQRPARAVFVFLGTISDISLALGKAAEVAKQIDEPVDLIFVDPPWQIGVGQGRDGLPDADYYGRSRDLLVPGYEDVEPEADYYEWSMEWMQPAAGLLRPGGHMAVVTGPRQAAAAQMAAEHSGLTWRNSIVVPKINGVAPTRNCFANSHFRLTVLSAGDGRKKGDRTFNALPEFGADARGRPFPCDVWPPIQPHYARGRLRYPNQLNPVFADRVVRTYTNEKDLVVDFFNGSGTVPRVCLFRSRRCFASDVNPASLRFTMATIADIVRARTARPALFGAGLFPELEAQ